MTNQEDGDGLDLRRWGLAFAAVLALAVIAVVAWSVVFSTPASSSSGPRAAAPGPNAPGGAPGAERSGEVSAMPEPENIEELFQGADDAELQFFDPEDESLRGRMTFGRLEPRPNGRFFAEEPEAWLFLRNGVSARVTARETSFRKPAGASEPESGRFTGDVAIAIHRGRLDTAEAREASEPEATFRMDELHFDAALGQLRTASEVGVEARGVEGAFDGLEMVVDEVGRRLSHLSTRGGGWLRRVAAAEDVSRAQDERGEGEASAGEGERVDFYAARLDGGVELVSGGRTATGDQLEVWAELVGGALPADALAGFVTGEGEAGASGGGEADAGGGGSAEIRWSGRLVVEPRDGRPEELGDDALAGRLSSPATGVVEFADVTGFEAACASASYRAGSRFVTLAGAGASGVRVTMAEAGEMVCGRLEIDLTSGRARMPGPGELRAEAEAGDARRVARVISWQRGASMRLATSGAHVDTSGAWPIEEAEFRGGVTAREGDAEVAGETVTAGFGRTREGAATLERVVVEGGARATSPGQGRLLGERLTVEFKTRAEGGEPSPTSVLVEGRALAERGEEGIEAEILRATLGRDPVSDELRVERLEAELDVLVRGEGGEEALAERLEADPLRGVYDLVGEPATLRRGTASVTGGSMRLDEIGETLTVFGKGELSYRAPGGGEAADSSSGSSRGYERVTAAWAGTMVYDGTLGEAEFTGDVVVVGEPDELTRDTLRGERVIVDVELDGSGGESAASDSAFRRARIIGEVEEMGEGRTAQVESRRYRRAPGTESGQALEFLAYLDGPTLIVDGATESLFAPSRGRLLFEDRRGGGGDGGDVAGGVTTRGTTLFEWDGAARFERSSGEAVMSRGVRLRQKAPGSERVTELECERLEASFELPEGEGEVRAGSVRAGAELTLARASGAVYAKQGARELIADRLEFDAQEGVAEAWANRGNVVTIYDGTRPIPLTGSVLRWDLKRDRIEWMDAGTTTAPR